MTTRFRIIIAPFIFMALFPLLASAQGRFEIFEFEMPGQVWDVINEDLDGDGLLEVMALHVDRSAHPPRRYLTIYPQDRDKGFDPARKIEWHVPAEVAAIDVGDVTADPGRELVVITEKGVYYATVGKKSVSGLKEFLPAQSVVAIPSKREIPYYNFVWDYTGDGRDDVLVCGFYDTLFARQEDGYEFSTRKINLRPDIDIIAFDISALMVSPEHPIFRVSYQAPQVYSSDYNADGLPDLIANFRDDILIFEQGAEGFSRDPVRSYHIELFEEQKEQMRGPPTQFDFEDIDGDSRVDMVAHNITGRIGAMKSRSVLFWGKSDNIAKGKPDIEFETEHTVMAKIIIWDVNGDGHFDLIMPTYDISAWNLGKILVTGEITVEWVYFLQREDHTFPQVPDRIITTDMKVNVLKFRLESGIPNVVADFNGDGFPDQAIGESEKVLLVTLRDQNGQLMQISERVEVPVAMFFRGVDLNMDGLSDIIMYYIENEERSGEVRVLMNRGNWVPKN